MTQSSCALYDSLSNLLVYPTDASTTEVAECERLLKECGSPARSYIATFAKHVQGSTVENLEELYTRTFEINPVCTMEIGWHLFGERYERGAFLVKMRQAMRQFQLAESAELPDHLIHVLQVLGRMAPDEATTFVSEAVMPAIDKMMDGFKDKDNVYRAVLQGIVCELKNRHGIEARSQTC
ncbi:MAG: nitrate reductase molybdenum cofactor assembly chaperone [Candidatus Zixiibacteriota bacterium]